MVHILKKENKTLFILLFVCAMLNGYHPARADETKSPLTFKRIASGGNNDRFMIVPADNTPLEALTGLKTLSKEEYERIANLPVVQFYNNKPVMAPASVNNAQTPYFRPIFTQSGGCCAQAAGIGYAFTYEINWQRKLNASLEENQYPTHYTYNFLNGGMDIGSWYFDGWDIIKDNGCPNVVTYGGMGDDITKWMSGYDKYYSGMHNRVADYARIPEINTPAGLSNLKRWLVDHGNGSSGGGVACFAVYIGGAEYVDLPTGTPYAGKSMLVRWGNAGYHAMTIVGFDDEVQYDFNYDGQYTNNIDLNGDGVITMNDWEKGALIYANSWGTDYMNGGFCYMAYKSIADLAKNGESAITWNAVHVVTIKPAYEPKVVIKTELSYLSRNRLEIYASVTQNGTTKLKKFDKCFTYLGGNLPLRGLYDYQSSELGLDVTSLFEQINSLDGAQFNLYVYEYDPYNTSTGFILTYSLLDYTNGVSQEILCSQSNIELNNALTTLSISRCPLEKVRVSYCSYNINPESNTLFVNFRIYNESNQPINLADLKTKYWYSCENMAGQEFAVIDWAGVLPAGRGITTAALTEVAAINQGNQNRICTIAFKAAAGRLLPDEYVEGKVRIYKNNWTSYNQTNDYSFGTQHYYTDWTKLTVYLQNTIIWGTEPSGN